MATAERPDVTPADDRAWEVFFEALDADSDIAKQIPPGAAIVAADSPERDELVARYHADHRSVVVVHADGRSETLRPRRSEVLRPLGLDLHHLLLIGGGVALVWRVLRSGVRIPR
jgi:hypothetical protein